MEPNKTPRALALAALILLAVACGGHDVRRVPDRSQFRDPSLDQPSGDQVGVDGSAGDDGADAGDGAAPLGLLPAPTIDTDDGQALFVSNGSSLAIAGKCVDGSVVRLDGMVTAAEVLSPQGELTMPCNGGAFRFVVAKDVDGDYTFKISQSGTHPDDDPSSPATAQWTRDTTPPPAPVRRTPLSAFYASGDDRVDITGACEDGGSVQIAGGMTKAQPCKGGSFAFTFTSTADGRTDFTLTQTDAAGNMSPATTQTWVRDSTIPQSPSIVTPALSLVPSSSPDLTISGKCMTGFDVTLSGDLNAGDVMTPEGDLTAPCQGTSYTFVLRKAMDGTFNILIRQTNPANGKQSAIASLVWMRDTVAPAPPSLTAPVMSPFTSSESSLVIQGACESGAVVSLSGASTGTRTCANGVFNFLVTKTSDGNYDFSLSQADAAGNTSGATPLRWQRDSTSPPPPAISSPSPSPHVSSGSTVRVAGTCTTGFTVRLSGDVVAGDVTSPAGSLVQTCSGGAFAFTIAKSADDTFRFYVSQRSVINGVASSEAQVTWIRDTIAPGAPAILNPSMSPYTSPSPLTIAGACENGAAVNLSGASTLSTTCAGGVFTFTVPKATDGTYTFNVTQTDRAGNASTATTQVWQRMAAVPAAPVIALPTAAIHLSNGNDITISGSCQDGLTVRIAGDVAAGDVTSPAGSLTQTCAVSSFTFTIAKTADGGYDFSVTQATTERESAPATRRWVRDATPPNTTITAMPSSPNELPAAVFGFTATDGAAVFECGLVDGPSPTGIVYSSCTSPKSYEGLVMSTYTFAVRSRDAAGNVDPTPATFTWNQATRRTIALYHLDADAETVDSSLSAANVLTDVGTAAEPMGKFDAARRFSAMARMTAAHSEALASLASAMTVDTWVRLETPLADGQRASLVDKWGAAGNYGWRLQLVATAGQVRLGFSASLDGVGSTELLSSPFDLAAGDWHHVAATWSRGAVKLYLDGAAVGSGTVGTVGQSTIFATTSELHLGGQAGSYLDGSLDEVRLSREVRWTAAFTPPTEAYTAD